MGPKRGARPRCCPGPKRDEFNGLIQHSFALRMPDEHWRFLNPADRDAEVRDYFTPQCGEKVARFEVRPLSDLSASHEAVGSIPLARQRFINTKSRQVGYFRRDKCGGYTEKNLPRPFEWAGLEKVKAGDEEKFAFLESQEDDRSFHNDYWVMGPDGNMPESTSRFLLELLAHKRTLLFGLALANRFVNVMLPHATLIPPLSIGCRGQHPETPCGPWILQPLVSLLRSGRGHSDFGRMYSLTFFLIPVDKLCGGREATAAEIACMVNAGWSLGLSPRRSELPQFDVCGGLNKYVSRLSGLGAALECQSLTLREAIESIAFGVALRGAWNPTDCKVRRRIGDGVIMSLGSARVSTVVVVDPHLSQCKVREPIADNGPPGQLESLMGALAKGTRTPSPPWSRAEQRKYRLDRPFVDGDSYVFGALPANRCLVVASAADAQEGRRESALIQAASAAYLTIGAATAIGTMRAIDRDLEETGPSEPGMIANVEHEVATDLHEIYDLDITREAYRQLYRRLRDRLGITRDYKTLQAKMGALYRTTSTRHEVKSQARLVWLTAAIVFLSVLILVGTIVLAGKPGG